MRIGILGYGSIGSRHGRNLVALGHKVIIHDPAMAESLPKDEVIKQSDAVVIASPTSEHLNDIRLCGKKPCFVEKPYGNSIPKGVSPWMMKHPPLMVGYNMRFHPCVLKAKEWLSDGRIGTPQWASFICAQFNDKPEYLRDGVTLNWSHEIDLALHLLGPAEVQAAAIDKKDTIADIILRTLYEWPCQTHIHLDYVTRPEHRGFSISGDKGLIIANLPERQIVMLGLDGIPKQVERYQGSYDDDYVMEMRGFIDRVECQMDDVESKAIGCTAEEAIEVLKICLRAKKVAGI